MSEKLDAQLQAINTLVATLEPLSAEERANVLDFVFRSLGIVGPVVGKPIQSTAPVAPVVLPAVLKPAGSVDIRSFTKEKNPSSANQMIAVVGYYLTNLAPEGERRDHIVQDDIKKYFVQGGFPLPTAPPRMTLSNAKNAGYLDALGDGTYRLNPVGHNLVAHRLPRSGEGDQRKASAKPKRSAKKKL